MPTCLLVQSLPFGMTCGDCASMFGGDKHMFNPCDDRLRQLVLNLEMTNKSSVILLRLFLAVLFGSV